MASRRLTFAVSTSLLSASLAVGAGCHHRTSNPAPEQPDEPHVNPGPEEREAENIDEVDAPAADADADAAADADPDAEPDADAEAPEQG